MLVYRNNKLTLLVLALFFVVVLGYAYFEARNILYGPIITIPMNDGPVTVTEQLVIIKGNAQNINEIRMDGRPIPVTEEGAFEESLLLPEGYTQVEFTATDKIGRSTSEMLEIVYVPKREISATTTTLAQ